MELNFEDCEKQKSIKQVKKRSYLSSHHVYSQIYVYYNVKSGSFLLFLLMVPKSQSQFTCHGLSTTVLSIFKCT